MSNASANVRHYRSCVTAGIYAFALLFVIAFTSDLAIAHGIAPPATLSGVAPPKSPGLLDGARPIVVDREAAVILGKSLFWDSSVGADGVACATCHFHAGADRRTQNQMGPGQAHLGAVTASTFEAFATGEGGQANHELKGLDFPLYRVSDPKNKASTVTFNTDDVVGSAGVTRKTFVGPALQSNADDTCSTESDPLFHSGGLNVRQVTTRNAPSVINAVFNFRNFWDGRANNRFNGETAFGKRDPSAGVWVTGTDGRATKKSLALRNASLASQAVAPPNNEVEMACAGRTFPDLARKLLYRRPLAKQAVSPTDGVLGKLRQRSGLGLRTRYRALIRKAFAPRFWKGNGNFGQAVADGTAYTQTEANFSFFFGLAIQLYEATLISDRSPYDTPLGNDGLPKGLTQSQKRGLGVFLDAHCVNCHRGPTFSSAAHPDIFAQRNENGPILVERSVVNGSVTGQGVAFALRDQGYANTSVTPYDHDLGIGASDPFGTPLSFAAQYLNALQQGRVDIVDPIGIYPCDFERPFVKDFAAAELTDDTFGQGPGKCRGAKAFAKVPRAEVLSEERNSPERERALVAVNGAFKIPSLRNVELTGPYMHNGSMKSLEEVVDFYDRGGNLSNPAHFATLVFQQSLDEQRKSDLIAFLKSLTDERVRWERAPFDHPALRVANGHEDFPSAENPGVAADRFLDIAPVGNEGRTKAEGPLQPFTSYLTR